MQDKYLKAPNKTRIVFVELERKLVERQDFLFQSTDIHDLILIQPFTAFDKRGYISKIFERNIFAEHNIELSMFEELQSFSCCGTLRGLHFQRRYSQNKLVRVLRGSVYDVAVDLRKGSPTFGAWKGVYLSEENRTMFYIPKGFAHGFLALEEGTLLSYLCGDRYDPESDGGILWNDPELGIEWPLEQVGQVILSEKDQKLSTLSEFRSAYGGLMVEDP